MLKILKKTYFLRRIVDKFLFFGFNKYFHGCKGAKYLAKMTHENYIFLPCINFEYVRNKSRRFLRYEPQEELKFIFVGNLNIKFCFEFQ